MNPNTEITDKAIEKVKLNNIADYNSILSFTEDWISSLMKSFTSEDLKTAYYSAGNEIVSEPRVFGAVFKRLSRIGEIRATNEFRISNNPKCHNRPQRIWISRNFALKQQKNAKKEASLSLFPNAS